MKNKYKINGLKYPTFDKLNARTSTLCRSMACTITIRKPCTDKEEKIWLKHFKNMKCAYCGKDASHLDHLYPLIINRRPTGYGTEVANLVPCCKDCNQPKGNLSYENFMRSEKCHHVMDKDCKDLKESIEKRITNISNFEKELPTTKLNFSDEAIKIWDEMLKKFDEALKEAQETLNRVKINLENNSN